jgi:hypothetical protein
MRQTRASSNRLVPNGLIPPRLRTEVLMRDFDQIESAEEEAKTWVERGHYYSADIPRNS